VSWRVSVSVIGVLALSCASQHAAGIVPSAGDWVEYGVVLEAGPEDSWDALLAGASSPAGVVARDGTYFLYYGGADGLRADGGPRHRAIGVATSPDGVRFTKFAGNPVMRHLPTEDEEEGANSAAVTLDEAGRIVMFYGAATHAGPERINADGRVAVSEDGLHFEDLGLRALDHRDPRFWGHGDELFPLAAYRNEGVWYVFYVPNGTAQARDLAVAWGPRPGKLRKSAQVIDGERDDPARMGGTVCDLGDGTIALFVQRGWRPAVRAEVRLAPASEPQEVSRPIETYDTPLWNEETKFFTVFLDRARRTWFLYRLNWKNQFVLHLAPAGEPDLTPPGPPKGLALEAGQDGVELLWREASDPETGVVAYDVYRDGRRLARTLDLSWVDRETEPTEDTAYEVAAVNFHGVAGPRTAVSSPGPAPPESEAGP
jgi:hypothetical protein